MQKCDRLLCCQAIVVAHPYYSTYETFRGIDYYQIMNTNFQSETQKLTQNAVFLAG